TPHSVVRDVAKDIDVVEIGNDLFLDRDEGETRENMRKLLSIAVRRGSAIGIIHAKSASLEDLRWMIDEARKDGVDFLSISQMIARQKPVIAEGERL
ncbi:MAG: divergent polysaccharide deacetylase family protein, partial [Candidatus Krumholzibacteria bacterium]|nr:divergent polysaccharide deacetylase family protein [Candidatus Krumholzibacteria bacterium]